MFVDKQTHCRYATTVPTARLYYYIVWWCPGVLVKLP